MIRDEAVRAEELGLTGLMKLTIELRQGEIQRADLEPVKRNVLTRPEPRA